MTIYENLRERWLIAAMDINSGLPEKDIESFERKHKLLLPACFRRYVMTVNGMRLGVVDENLVSFLSLERIDHELTSKQTTIRPDELVVAEYSLFCHWYILRVAPQATSLGVFVSNGDLEKLIAPSFDEFVRNYLKDAFRIAHCWG